MSYTEALAVTDQNVQAPWSRGRQRRRPWRGLTAEPGREVRHRPRPVGLVNMAEVAGCGTRACETEAQWRTDADHLFVRTEVASRTRDDVVEQSSPSLARNPPRRPEMEKKKETVAPDRRGGVAAIGVGRPEPDDSGPSDHLEMTCVPGNRSCRVERDPLSSEKQRPGKVSCPSRQSFAESAVT